MATPSPAAKPSVIGKAGKPGVTTTSKGAVTTKEAARPKVTPLRPPAFKIETSHTKSRYLKGLFYGDHGVGKTRLVATSSGVPEMRDVFMIDAEAGDMTLEDMGEKDKFRFGDIDITRITTFAQVASVQEFLKTHCRLREEGNTEGLRALEARFKGVEPSDIDEPRRYRTVILDSLGEIESLLIYQLLGVTVNTALDEEIQAEEWAEYKKNNNMMKRMIREFRNLPVHLLVTCPEKYAQDENKKMQWTPALIGQLSRQARGPFDIVGYLQTGVAESEEAPLPRRLYVQPIKGKKFVAKCRFSSYTGAYFDDPTMGTIMETVGLSSPTTQPKPKKGPK